MATLRTKPTSAKTRRNGAADIVVRNRDTGEVVARYRYASAARAHVARFPSDYIAKE